MKAGSSNSTMDSDLFVKGCKRPGYGYSWVMAPCARTDARGVIPRRKKAQAAGRIAAKSLKIGDLFAVQNRTGVNGGDSFWVCEAIDPNAYGYAEVSERTKGCILDEVTMQRRNIGQCFCISA